MGKGKRITGLEKAVMGIQQQFAKLAPEVIQPLDEMEKSTKEIGERMDDEFGKLTNRVQALEGQAHDPNPMKDKMDGVDGAMAALHDRVRDLEMRKNEQQGINASMVERLNKHNARLRTLEMADDSPLANLSKQQAESLREALGAKAKDAMGLPPLSEDEAPVRSEPGMGRKTGLSVHHRLERPEARDVFHFDDRSYAVIAVMEDDYGNLVISLKRVHGD